MDTRLDPPRPDTQASAPPPPPAPVTAGRPAHDAGSRAAAWITGTGAFLLVAAATVFVGVRWSALPLEAKVAIVGAATGAVLLAGARLQRRLPVAGAALLHLGAFLLPIDLAALLHRLDTGWPQGAIAEGLLVVATYPLLARAARSRVLVWATTAGVVSLATGLGAVSGVPAPVTVAVAAAALAVAEIRLGTREPLAAVLAVAAAAGPLVAATVAAVPGRSALVTDAGWAGPTPAALALAPALLAAGVLAVTGTQRRSPLLVWLTILAPLAGVATVGLRVPDLSRVAELLQLPLALVAVEAVALAGDRDPLWRGPTRWLAAGAEVAVAAVLPVALFVAVLPSLPGFWFATATVDVAEATAWTVTALAAGVATLRRSVGRGSLWAPGVLAGGILTAAAVASVTGDPVAVAGTLVASAAVLSVAGRDLAAVLAAGVTLVATASVTHTPAGALAVGVPAVLVGLVPVMRGVRQGRPSEPAAVLSGVNALVVLAAAVLGPEPGLLPRPVMATVFAAAAIGVALLVERDGVVAGAARGAVLLVSPVVADVDAAEALLPLAVATGLLLADGVRTGRRRWALLAVVPGLHLVVAAGVAAGFDPRTTTGLVAIAVGSGGCLAGVRMRRPVLGHTGAALVSAGAWLLLDAEEVRLVEAYVAPVAAHLLAAGVLARRRDPLVGSWLAYAPAILLLAVPALLERVDGGAGGHAVVAGAVGVAAVVTGAYRRLAAPLVLGVLLVVATTLHESVAVVASVPTWAWLAAGGAVLLGAGIALERHGTSPVAAGRTLAAGFRDRFV